ncbi:MAG TPA: LPS export ABC transporter periplasmic protein LptC [Burkholderiaceae bacterium]|nr:LPS export ABC transporter periplasmic protein LptC [Burkholderiaceae bacterium]
MAIDLDTLIDPHAPLPPPQVRVAPRLRQPWYWHVLQWLSAYLPVVLMALLALATWWLVQHTPRPAAPRDAVAPRHEPDYLMQGVLLQRFAPDGRLRVQVEGEQMRHYPDTDTLEVDRVTIRAWTAAGQLTVARAQRAVTNADASEVQLQGGATVVREGESPAERIEFESEFLHAFLNTEQLRSHLPVQIRHGSSQMRVGSIEYDHLARSARLGPPIRARFEPPRR